MIQVPFSKFDFPHPEPPPGHVLVRVEVLNARNKEDNGAIWILLPADGRAISEEGGLIFSDLRDEDVKTEAGDIGEVASRMSRVINSCLVCKEHSNRRCPKCKQATYCSQACF